MSCWVWRLYEVNIWTKLKNLVQTEFQNWSIIEHQNVSLGFGSVDIIKELKPDGEPLLDQILANFLWALLLNQASDLVSEDANKHA